MPANQPSPDQAEWERTCPYDLTSDTIWKLDVHRSALFLLHLARLDVRPVGGDRSRNEVGSQLIRAAGSISANIGEGYSRPTRADRLRFFGYALGSTRECVAWYLAATDILDSPSVIDARLALLSRIRALLLGLIRSLRIGRPRDPVTRFEP